MVDPQDPESKAWWREIENLELQKIEGGWEKTGEGRQEKEEQNNCCKVMFKMRMKGANYLICYNIFGVPRWRIEINFCPQCGRKIE